MPMLASLLAACEMVPETWHEPLYVPVLFSLVGIGIFAAGKAQENREMKVRNWKWAAFFPLAIALYSGITTANCMRDYFYWSTMMEFAAKKYGVSHFGALLVPIFSIAGILFWQWRSTRDPFRDAG